MAGGADGEVRIKAAIDDSEIDKDAQKLVNTLINQNIALEQQKLLFEKMREQSDAMKAGVESTGEFKALSAKLENLKS
jgi:hypothetical protein